MTGRTPARRSRICFVGWGAIAREAAALLAERRPAGIEIAAVAVRDVDARRPDIPQGARLISQPDQLAGLGVDLVVEAAGRPAVAVWGEAALRAGADVMVLSTSAFCDDGLLARLVRLAEETGGRLIVPPGALGAMDALAAASLLPLDEVEHTIAKPPAAWRSTQAEDSLDLDRLEEPATFFTGTARQVSDRFPQNANAAVIVALAGVGLDRTKVALVADPAIGRNVHRIRASGSFGLLEVRLENEALTANPKSSKMTALSLVRLIERRTASLIC